MDLRTLLLAGSAVSANLSLAMLYLLATGRSYPGFGLWTAGVIAVAAGNTLIALRSQLPEAISILLGNALIFLALYMFLFGLNRFVGRRTEQCRVILPLIAALSVLFYYWFVSPDLRARILVVSFVICAYLTVGWFTAFRHLPKVMLRGENLLLIGFGIFVASTFLRPLVVLFRRSTMSDLMSAGGFEPVAALVNILGVVTLVLGMIKINQQRLEEEFRQARIKLNALEGLLPLCSHCGKIRDEQDEWHSFENYLRLHSKAQVTHGLCPDCTRLLYPDIADSALQELAEMK